MRLLLVAATLGPCAGLGIQPRIGVRNGAGRSTTSTSRRAAMDSTLANDLQNKLLEAQGLVQVQPSANLYVETVPTISEGVSSTAAAGSPMSMDTLLDSVKHALFDANTALEAVISAAKLPDLTSWTGPNSVGERVINAATPLVTQTESFLQSTGLTTEQSQGAALALTAVGLTLVTTTLLSTVWQASFQKNTPLPTTYDLTAIEEFYQARPLVLYKRLASISYKIASFSLSLWVDSVTGNWERNMPLRAAQVR